MRTFLFLLVLGIIQTVPSWAQNTNTSDQNASEQSMQNMPGMNEHQVMPGMQMGKDTMALEPHSLIELLQHHATAGTDAEPNSTPFPMLMTVTGNWTLMLHGEAFLNEVQQTEPRGCDKLFSTNWITLMAQRKLVSG